MRRWPLFALFAILITPTIVAQPSGGRFALVIGNGNYAELAKLKNPANDASDMATALKGLGFEVELLVDSDLVAMEDAVLRLGNRLSGSPSAMGFFFYAGHGVQSNGTNYLIPADARIPSEPYLKTKALAAQEVLETIMSAKNGLNLIVLDACRDNPFGWARSGTRGLSVVNSQPSGSILVYATSAGSVAQDGAGRNGVFTQELLKNLQNRGLEIKDVFNRTGAAVRDATGGRQVPAVYSQFFDSAYLGAGASENAPTGTAPATASYGGSRPADLMVRSSEAGAEVFVEGVSKGRAPLLVQGLPSGRNIHVEARTERSSGSLDVTLKPGELGEVSVTLAARTGNLVISSSESAIRVLVDGVDRGPLGSGVVRDLAAGDHRLELVGQDLYFAQKVSVQAEATVQVAARVQGVGKLDIRAPGDASIKIRGDAYGDSITGPKIIVNLPEGSYRLEAGGGDYVAASATVAVKKGAVAVWEPFTTGTIAFDVEPRGASCLLSGSNELSAEGRVEGIAPGDYRALLKKAGYREAEVALSVAVGKLAKVKAALVALDPGSILIPRLGAEVELEVGGQRMRGQAESDGTRRFEGIPSGYPLVVKFSIPSAKASIPEQSVALGAGETVKLDLPSGRFALPWLAEGSSVSVQGRVLPNEGSPGFLSPPLPAGSYQASVSGKYPFDGEVEVGAMAETELPGYRQGLLAKLSSERTGAQKSLSGKKAKMGWGFASLGAGILGAAGTAAVYFLGTQAAADYSKAVDTAGHASARSRVELYGYLLPVAASVGGLGLGLSPVLLLGGPSPQALQRSIEALDEQIRALGN